MPYGMTNNEVKKAMSRQGLMDDAGVDFEWWCCGNCKKCKNHKCEEDDKEEGKNSDGEKALGNVDDNIV